MIDEFRFPVSAEAIAVDVLALVDDPARAVEVVAAHLADRDRAIEDALTDLAVTGPILTDRTTGDRYILFIDSGVLDIELV